METFCPPILERAELETSEFNFLTDTASRGRFGVKMEDPRIECLVILG